MSFPSVPVKGGTTNPAVQCGCQSRRSQHAVRVFLLQIRNSTSCVSVTHFVPAGARGGLCPTSKAGPQAHFLSGGFLSGRTWTTRFCPKRVGFLQICNELASRGGRAEPRTNQCNKPCEHLLCVTHVLLDYWGGGGLTMNEHAVPALGGQMMNRGKQGP